MMQVRWFVLGLSLGAMLTMAACGLYVDNRPNGFVVKSNRPDTLTTLVTYTTPDSTHTVLDSIRWIQFSPDTVTVVDTSTVVHHGR